MPPFCEKHQIYHVYDYVDGLAWKTCFCEMCQIERIAPFSPLPKDIKTTEPPSEAAAVECFEGILTEEELKERNRKLVHENDGLMAENVKLRKLVSLANNLIPSENTTWTNNLKTILEELNHE